MARARARDKDWEKKLIWGLGITGGVVAIWQGKKAYDRHKVKKLLEQHQQYTLPSGVNLVQVTTEINDAFYNYAYGTMEDEQSAMDSLMTVPLHEIPTVAVLYNSNYGHNLYDDFRKYLSNEDYAKIKHLLQ